MLMLFVFFGVAGASRAVGNRPAHRPAVLALVVDVLEGTVRDQLCIQSAVAAVVDVLKENAVEQRVDGLALLQGKDGQLHGAGCLL